MTTVVARKGHADIEVKGDRVVVTVTGEGPEIHEIGPPQATIEFDAVRGLLLCDALLDAINEARRPRDG